MLLINNSWKNLLKFVDLQLKSIDTKCEIFEDMIKKYLINCLFNTRLELSFLGKVKKKEGKLRSRVQSSQVKSMKNIVQTRAKKDTLA